MRTLLITAALLCMGLTMACSGGGSTPPPPSTGQLTIRLGSDSFSGMNKVLVGIDKVEGSADGANWIAFGSIKKSYDLMTLQNGQSAVVLPATAVPPGSYSQLRITWAKVNYEAPKPGLPPSPSAYVIPKLGTGDAPGATLTMPDTTIVPGTVTVPSSGSATAQIMLSSQQALQSRISPGMTFQATGKFYDVATAAKISGQLKDITVPGSPVPMPGVEVLAESLDGNFNPLILRRASTDGSGNYALEALPTGVPYFVVAQPVVYQSASLFTSYAATAAAVPTSGLPANALVANLTSFAQPSYGSLKLTVTPVSTANQATWGELSQSFVVDFSGKGQVLIVRSAPVVSELAQDWITFEGLPLGWYGVAAQRTTLGGTPAKKASDLLMQVSSSPIPTPVFISYP
jgi:hypothetical protein